MSPLRGLPRHHAPLQLIGCVLQCFSASADTQRRAADWGDGFEVNKLRVIACFMTVQLISGCATMYTSHNVGFNRDAYPSYTEVYSDGNRLVASYTVNNATGRFVDQQWRWVSCDISSLNWVSLTAIKNGKLTEYIPERGAFKPKDKDGLKNISLYTRLYPNPEFNKLRSKPGVTAVDMKLAYDGEIHRNDGSKFPFTAYDLTSDGWLMLIRDDINHQGQLEATMLAPAKDLSPGMRKVFYPFAVALDVVTSPLQLVFFGLVMIFYHGA